MNCGIDFLMTKRDWRLSCVLLPILILLTALLRVKPQCINDFNGGCDFALNTTLYFPPSSKLTALDDLREIRKNVFFTDRRCDISIEFSACYLLRVPCDDSLPRPICIDDCIVAETILKYSCATDFKLILLVNTTLSHILGRFVCQRPETYIEGTTNYSTHCFPLSKLRKMFENDIIYYQASMTTTATAATTAETTVLPPNDGNVVAIVMITLSGTIIVVVFIILLMWYYWKRKMQHQYSAPLTQPVASFHSESNKLNIYDDSSTSNYNDFGLESTMESTY